MFIRVQSNELKSSLTSLATGAKNIINITAKGNYLYMQKTGSIIQDIRVELMEPCEREVSITVSVTGIVKLIDGALPIEVVMDETIFLMVQDGFNIPLTAMHEERIEIETLEADLSGEVSASSIKQLAKTLAILEKYSKSLGVGESLVRFNGEDCVISYSNMIYKQIFNLHPLSLNANQVRELARVITRETGTIKYNIDTRRNMLHLTLTTGMKVVVQIIPLKSLDEFETFNGISDKCVEISTIDFSIKPRLEVLLKSIPKSHLEVVVTESELSVTSTGVQTIRVGTTRNKPLCNIRLTTVQLELLCLLMEGRLTVERGDNKVIWKTLDKTLMMSGLVF